MPEQPAAIKALPVNISSILVAWQPPENPNGILTHYTLYYRNSSVPVVSGLVASLSDYVSHLAGLGCHLAGLGCHLAGLGCHIG